MKTKFLFLLILLCGAAAWAQPTPVAPATQAEVDAGLIHSKFVAPDTLNGLSAIRTSPATFSNDLARAVAGQTLVFAAGTYTNPPTVTNFLKRGVNYLGLPGANILFRQFRTNDWTGVFDDRTVGPTTNRIAWDGSVAFVGLTNMGFYDTNVGGFPYNNGTLGAVVITNATSKPDFEFGRVGAGSVSTVVGTPACIYVGGCRTGSVVRVRSDTFNSLEGFSYTDPDTSETILPLPFIGLYTQIANLDAHFGQLNGTSYGWLWGEPSGEHDANVRVFCESVTGKTYGDAHSTNFVGWFEAMEMVMSSAGPVPIGVYGNGKWYFTLHGKVQASGGPVIQTSPAGGVSNAFVWVKTPKMSGDRGFVDLTGGNVQIECEDYEDRDTSDATSGFVIRNGSNLIVNGGNTRTNCNGKIIQHDGGSAVFKLFNGYSTDDIAVSVRGAGLQLQACTFKSGGTNTLNATNAQQVTFLAGGVMGNKTNNPNVAIIGNTNGFILGPIP